MDLIAIAAATSFMMIDLNAKIQSLLVILPDTISTQNLIMISAKVFTAMTIGMFITRITGYLILRLLERSNNNKPPYDKRPTYFLYTHVSSCSGDGQSVCTVCLCEGTNDVLLQCGHSFHWACIKRWLDQNNVCPLCKKRQSRVELDREGKVVLVVV